MKLFSSTLSKENRRVVEEDRNEENVVSQKSVKCVSEVSDNCIGNYITG